jgi:hypothetical protein
MVNSLDGLLTDGTVRLKGRAESEIPLLKNRNEIEKLTNSRNLPRCMHTTHDDDFLVKNLEKNKNFYEKYGHVE